MDFNRKYSPVSLEGGLIIEGALWSQGPCSAGSTPAILLVRMTIGSLGVSEMVCQNLMLGKSLSESTGALNGGAGCAAH